MWTVQPAVCTRGGEHCVSALLVVTCRLRLRFDLFAFQVGEHGTVGCDVGEGSAFRLNRLHDAEGDDAGEWDAGGCSCAGAVDANGLLVQLRPDLPHLALGVLDVGKT